MLFIKNGMNTYVQLSSPNTEVLKYMRDSSPLSVTALVEFISTLPAQEETEFELQTPPTEGKTDVDKNTYSCSFLLM